MRRLTKKDWETINAALAAYEAEGDPSALGVEEDEVDDHFAAIKAARQKVWERLD